MFKYLSFLVLALLLFNCNKKTLPSNSLYEVLYVSEYGGTAFEFYEIFTDEKEFRLLLNDSELKKRVKPEDIKTANFIILNMGQKNSGGYSISIKKVVNTKDALQVFIEKKSPKPNEPVNMAITNPMAIVKINSKKKIQIME